MSMKQLDILLTSLKYNNSLKENMILSPLVTSNRTKSAFSELEKQFITVHKDKYDYSKSVYLNSNTPLEIVCKEHNVSFFMTSGNHRKGKGCNICATKRTANLQRKDFTKDVLPDLIKVHNNKYIYCNDYTNTDTHIKVYCKACKIVFSITPYKLIARKQGCKNCGIKRTIKPFSEIRERFISVHGKNRYIYDESSYVDSMTKITIRCGTCNTTFTQKPNCHLNGKGCPICSVSGFKINKPGLLYYFKITNGNDTAWKIGITNLSIQQRYSIEERSKISDIISVWYMDGKEAYLKEQQILNIFKKHKYTGPKLLNSGNTELFNKDIFNNA